MPSNIKIYHIVHVDKLASVIAGNGLHCDAYYQNNRSIGTNIGMNTIKQRRLKELKLNSHPGLYVGDCVPFYFCPRSVMLFLFHKNNSNDIDYRGGQEPIIHLEADLDTVIQWANAHQKKWAFSLSNAGSYYFEDRNNISALQEINWAAVHARDWRECREEKQAEFLIEDFFPFELIERIGVFSQKYLQMVNNIYNNRNQISIEVKRDWYY